MKDLMSKGLLRTSVLLIGIIFIFSSLGVVFATDPTPSPSPEPTQNPLMQANDATVAFLTWQILDSWGISVRFNDIYEYTTEVQNQIQTWIFEYLDTLPSPITVAAWIMDWQYSTDFWGNLVGNNSMLDDLQDFADWLVEKFGLDDNDSIVINGTPQISGGYTTYRWGVFYSTPLNNNYIAIGISANAWVSGNPYNGTTGGYYFYSENRSFPGLYDVVLVSEIPFSQAVKQVDPNAIFNGIYLEQVRENGTINVNSTGNGDSRQGNPSQLYYSTQDLLLTTNDIPINAVVYTLADQALLSISDFMNNASITMNGNLGIITHEINLPIDDSSYTPGDSITVVNGEPQYSIVEWPTEMAISNLPAIVSTGNIPIPGDELNPGMVDAWRPISSLISVAADSMAVVLGIIYEFPEEVIIPIYAVMGGIIIFGLIHAMKEH